ncbi:PQQ-binding-like beta-propeller repeat protein [Streptomyces sp. JJ38]|uniref:outer membrane protein assembly factor BamB family protein n=1 Tax=Streptomyces sp. JJ38 TaxID=2738128 RepID=UPI001C55D913|nr:PQQ-binding-like beta-propeller repeat protein [Streptomyces sp. JJ38]MBW1596814.1 PQQ-binding-like beta-propeller repeat protein [Streptomyces sp. JJ38]
MTPRQFGPYRVLEPLPDAATEHAWRAVAADGASVVVWETAASPDASSVTGPFVDVVVNSSAPGESPGWVATADVPALSLGTVVKRYGPLPSLSVLALGYALARALSAVHAAGLLLGALTPADVVLTRDGPLLRGYWSGPRRRPERAWPGFSAPERLRAPDARDPKADVFSLGAVLRYAATGEGPFGSGPAQAVEYRARLLPPDTVRLPAQLHPLRAMLSAEPGHRPGIAPLTDALAASPLAAEVAGTGWLPGPIARAVQAGGRPAEPEPEPQPGPDLEPGPEPEPQPEPQPETEPETEPERRRTAGPAGTGRPSRRLLLGGAVATGTLAAGWAVFRAVGGPRGASGDVRWRARPGHALSTRPASGGGLVVSACQDGHLHAHAAGNGAEQWASKAISGPSAPALAAKRWVVTTSQGQLHILDGRDGSRTRSRELDLHDISPAAAGRELAFAHSEDGALHAVELATGHTRWTAPGRMPLISGIPPVEPVVAGGSVYSVAADGVVLALDSDTGAELWRFTAHTAAASPPTLTDHAVYVTVDDGTLYALDRETGSTRWSVPTTRGAGSAPAATEESVFAGGAGGTLHALRAADGSELWSASVNAAEGVAPLVLGDTLYAGDWHGGIRALDTGSGQERWAFRPDDWLTAPSTDGRTLYAGGRSGTLYALWA